MSGRVAIIGLGAMGSPMARRLIATGHDVTVCDIRPEAVKPFAATGVRVAQRPMDCRDADLILCLVATAEQLQSVVTGEHGIAPPGIAGQLPVVAAMGTVGRDALLQLMADVSSTGVRLLDAPVSGGPVRAEQGRLSVMLGGALDDVEATTPVWKHLGQDVFHCGPIGAAQVIKVANNLIGAVNTLISGEVYSLLKDLGVPVAEAIGVFEASSGRNWLSATCDASAEVFSAYAADGAAFHAISTIMRKDSALGAQLASEADGSFPMISALGELTEQLGDDTFSHWRKAANLHS